MKKLITSFIVVILFVITAFSQNQGDVAPDFMLKDLNNMDYKLSENRGKVILVFLVGYNCTLCLQSAPSVKSKLVDAFSDNNKFQTIVIDVWNGSASAFQSFKNSTNLNAVFLQKGSGVANSWSTTKDRLFVIDSEGKIAFKGTRAAKSDTDAAKTSIQNALSNLTTSVSEFLESDGFSLSQNYPNPALREANIDFVIPKSSEVKLSVFDISGKMIDLAVNNYYPAGKHSVKIELSKYDPGIYLYKLEVDEFSSTKRMIIK